MLQCYYNRSHCGTWLPEVFFGISFFFFRRRCNRSGVPCGTSLWISKERRRCGDGGNGVDEVNGEPTPIEYDILCVVSPQMPTPGRILWNQTMGFLFPKNVLYPILSGPGTFTPWKIKMEPKNGGLEDDFPFPLVMFWFHPLIFHLHLPLKTTQKSR